MPHTPPRGRSALALALAIQLGWGLVFIARTPVTIDGTRYFTLFDDAMISMRYARNLTDGYGLVWNPGGARVEGYSNFLWTLVMAAFHAIAGERIVPLLVSLAGLALLLANILVVWFLARRLAPDLTRAPMLAVLMVACAYSLGYWTLRGMEVGLLALLIDAAVLGVLAIDSGSRGVWLAIALALLPLVRADGAVPALLIGGYAWAIKRRPAHAWIFVALPLAAVAAHTGFRFWYYGEWMPNTYYLKMTGAPLTARLWRGLTSTAWEAAWTLWPMAALGVAARPLVGDRRLLALVAAVMVLYSVYVGGDAWEWTGHVNRYLVCATPLALVLAAIAIDERSARPPSALVAAMTTAAGLAAYTVASARHFFEPDLAVGRPLVLAVLYAAGAGAVWCCLTHARAARAFAVLAALLIVVTLSGAKTLEWICYNDRHVVDDRYSTELGIRLGEFTTPGARLAVVTAGAVPYFSRRWCIDLLGKNDPYIARLPAHLPLYPGHDKWDYRYTIDTWRPDLIVHLWQASEADQAYAARAGYVGDGPRMLVRRDSHAVDRERLWSVTRELERRHDAIIDARYGGRS